MNLSKYNCNKQNKYETIKIRKRNIYISALYKSVGIISKIMSIVFTLSYLR